VVVSVFGSQFTLAAIFAPLLRFCNVFSISLITPHFREMEICESLLYFLHFLLSFIHFYHFFNYPIINWPYSSRSSRSSWLTPFFCIINGDHSSCQSAKHSRRQLSATRSITCWRFSDHIPSGKASQYNRGDWVIMMMVPTFPPSASPLYLKEWMYGAVLAFEWKKSPQIVEGTGPPFFPRGILRNACGFRFKSFR
jgi:hypothetical protein